MAFVDGLHVKHANDDFRIKNSSIADRLLYLMDHVESLSKNEHEDLQRDGQLCPF